MSKTSRIEELEEIIFDLLDGQYGAGEIRNNTGLSIERCTQIQGEFERILQKKRKTARESKS